MTATTSLMVLPQVPKARYEEVTETTGVSITREGACMMASRYGWAAELGAGRRVLEIGCGSGVGLGWIASRAAFTCGVDYSAVLLGSGRAHYQDRMRFVRGSGVDLPFADGVFDLIVCFEALYYIPDMSRAFREIARLLRPGGRAAFVNANPERPDFIRSPYSTHYHTADEFCTALAEVGLGATVEGAFPVENLSPAKGLPLRGTILGLTRTVLQRLGLVPRTLRGRARLKRLVYGASREVPPEIGPGFAEEFPRMPVAPGPVLGFKVLYVLASRQE